MHKHGRQDCDPVVAGADLSRSHGPAFDESLTTHQLQDEHKSIGEDNENRNGGDTCWPSRGIRERDHSSHAVLLVRSEIQGRERVTVSLQEESLDLSSATLAPAHSCPHSPGLRTTFLI